MNEESWPEARLIPTSGINGADEQERRATSALLAVLGAVKEYGRVVTRSLGAPAGTVTTFIEVPFTHGDRKVFPDGVIRVSRGQKVWTALVEVKTGSNVLDAAQLETYLDVARQEGFDALVTISNEIPAMAGQHPTDLDRRRAKGVAVHHFAWTQLLAEAVIQREHRGVADPDQAWILAELIRYLEHPRSGALEFVDMGASWVRVREAVNAGTSRPTDDGVGEVAGRFDALLRFASLRLGRRLGTDVVPGLSRREIADPTLRRNLLIETLTGTGTMSGTIRVPGAVAPLVVTADLRAGKVTCSVDVEAPKEGRALTRVRWVVRQLQSAPGSVRVEAFVAHARGAGRAELLKDVREDPSLLVADPDKSIKGFRVALDRPLGPKRARGRGGFIDSVLETVDEFYGEVLEGIRAWTAAAPHLREEQEAEPVAPALVSSSLSSQDGPDDVRPPRELPKAPAPACDQTPDAPEMPETPAARRRGRRVAEAPEPERALVATINGDVWIDLRDQVVVLDPSPVTVPEEERAPTGPLPSRRELRLAREAAERLADDASPAEGPARV